MFRGVGDDGDDLAEPIMPRKHLAPAERDLLYPNLPVPPEVDNPDLHGDEVDAFLQAGLRTAGDIADTMVRLGRTKRYARERSPDAVTGTAQ